MELTINWEDVTCPICLDFPHNGVLLQCSSYEKGCRPFICDTDHAHSNCLERFRTAYGMPASAKLSSAAVGAPSESVHSIPPNQKDKPSCPLCRGDVTGWVVVDKARTHLNVKRRCCEEKKCTYVGNYLELQKHVNQKHPHARPAEVDPARQLHWDNLQQSSEIIDVLSIIHAEVPRGVVLGDYVIEYGDDESGDEYEDIPVHKGSWWTSCILCQVFDNSRASRNRRRSRMEETRSPRPRSSFGDLYRDEGSTSYVDIAEYRFDDSDDELFSGRFDGIAASGSFGHRSSWRCRVASMSTRRHR